MHASARTAAEAAELMREFHVGTLVVVDGTAGKVVPVGLVTDRDITIAVVAAHADPDSVRVSDVMRPALITANVADDIYATIQVMRDQGIRRLPVVDDDGTLVAIVSQDDLYAHLSREMAALATVSRQQQAQEAAIRR